VRALLSTRGSSRNTSVQSVSDSAARPRERRLSSRLVGFRRHVDQTELPSPPSPPPEVCRRDLIGMRRGGGGEGGGGICHLARSNARGHRLISVIRPRRFSLSLSLSLTSRADDARIRPCGSFCFVFDNTRLTRQHGITKMLCFSPKGNRSSSQRDNSIQREYHRNVAPSLSPPPPPGSFYSHSPVPLSQASPREILPSPLFSLRAWRTLRRNGISHLRLSFAPTSQRLSE